MSTANTNDLAATEFQVHTTTLDVIASLRKWMYGLWAASHAVHFTHTRVEAGMKDEASACRCKHVAEDVACILAVAALQPSICAMRYDEIFGHPSRICPPVTNYKRGAELTIHIVRVLVHHSCHSLPRQHLFVGTWWCSTTSLQDICKSFQPSLWTQRNHSPWLPILPTSVLFSRSRTVSAETQDEWEALSGPSTKPSLDKALSGTAHSSCEN